MAEERGGPLEDDLDAAELETDAQLPLSSQGGRDFRATYDVARGMAKRRSAQAAESAMAKQAARLVGGAAVKALAGPVGWALLAKDLLSNPTTRRLALLAIFTFLAVVTAGILIALAILGPFLKSWGGTGLPDAMAATNKEDMDIVRYLKCLDEIKPDATALPETCAKSVREGIVKAKEYAQRLRSAYTNIQETDEKTKVNKQKFMEALALYETELEAMEQNITKVKELREHKAKLLAAKEQLDATVSTLGITLTDGGLDVPLVAQPNDKDCGNASVAMVVKYFASQPGSQYQPTQVFSLTGFQPLFANLNSELTKVFPDKRVQYTDFRGSANNPAYFTNIMNSLKHGAPVVIFTSFYNQHIMVITGYDPATERFIINDPNVGKSTRGTASRDNIPIPFTKEEITKRADYPGDVDGYFYYAGDKSFR